MRLRDAIGNQGRLRGAAGGSECSIGGCHCHHCDAAVVTNQIARGARNLIVPRDWPVMRRGAAAKVQTNFIDIAPSPPFRRIVAFDDGMAGLAKMLGGMTVWRAVAAADMA